MRLIQLSAAALATFILGAAVPAYADAIPYGNAGHLALANTFTAAVDGDIIGYLVHGGAHEGGGAADTDLIRMIDVTTSVASAWLFDNQTTAPGTSATFGTVSAGDMLEFQIWDQSFPGGGGAIYSSNPLNSQDGTNHFYAAAWTGSLNPIGGVFIPDGTYLGAEDRPFGSSDLNYNDDSFVFTNVASSGDVPEPASLLLLGTGLVVTVRRIRRKSMA